MAEEHNHQVAKLDPALIPGLAGVLRSLVMSDDITDVEAEGALMAALEAAAQDEPGERTARRVELMERDVRDLIREDIVDLGAFLDERLAGAREKLLAISDEEWAAAGGTLD